MITKIEPHLSPSKATDDIHNVKKKNVLSLNVQSLPSL